MENLRQQRARNFEIKAFKRNVLDRLKCVDVYDPLSLRKYAQCTVLFCFFVD